MNPLTNTVEAASAVIERFCSLNHILLRPAIKTHLKGQSRYYYVDSCGFYRNGTLHVMPEKCARTSTAEGGMQWSYPGWMIDRTPGGVLFHEFGHFIDDLDGFKLGKALHKRTGEARLTNYCPDASEWFAEMFRLFMSNPDLLRLVRPETYANLSLLYPKHPVTEKWDKVLASAPKRVLRLAAERIGASDET